MSIETRKENKVFPRNLTAQAYYLVPGNPVVTRPEDAVANCFPGLEVDIRNLDRRFFPGLVFEFVAGGAKVAYVDALEDPDVDTNRVSSPYKQLAKKLYTQLNQDGLSSALENGNPLPGEPNHRDASGTWYLEWIEIEGRKNRKSNQTSARNAQKKKQPRKKDTNVIHGHRLVMPRPTTRVPDVSGTVWRLVRSLEAGPVKVQLELRDVRGVSNEFKVLTLQGWRRRYTDAETGVISLAYQPGELGQGLCSPWQHDFRDCQCFYWAANHPDIVLGELYPGESLPSESESADTGSLGLGPPGGESSGGRSFQGEPILASVPLDWIRADRSRPLMAGALGTIAANRPYQLDHFQINKAWQDLSIVLSNREIGGVYTPQTIDTANPYGSIEELGNVLRAELVPLELALVFEYLYAYFSLLKEEEAHGRKGLEGAVMIARQHLMLVATSEMQHLHWANQLLWELKLTPRFEPILTPADCVPTNNTVVDAQSFARKAKLDRERAREGSTTQGEVDIATRKAIRAFTRIERLGPSRCNIERARESEPGPASHSIKCGPGMRDVGERCLAPNVIDDFIAVEHPSGFIDGAYARVIATLNKLRRPDMAELAMRIAADGMQHEVLFREIKAALLPYFPSDLDSPPIYLRDLRKGTASEAKRALEPIKTIRENLRIAYMLAGNGAIEHSGRYISEARGAMTELLDAGEQLAAEDGIGIPFFEIWKSP
jgi:hypothetical protein